MAPDGASGYGVGLIRQLLGGSKLERQDATGPAWPDPLEGTNVGIWPDVYAFWAETYGAGMITISPAAAERVWAANRCIQLNAQQIASMPLEFVGSYEPAWVSNPDPNWYPNGIGDALFAIVRSLYGWGFAILLVTSR